VRTCFLFVVIGLVSAAGQSTSTTYAHDISGNRVPDMEKTVTKDGVLTDLRRSINGKEVPFQQIEEKVLSKVGSTTVTERIVRHYGADGKVVLTERIVTDETKTGDGQSTVHATTFRSDLNGDMAEAERKTIETRKMGAATVTDTSVESKSLNGGFNVAEKRTLTSEPISNGKQENETVMLRDANGGLYEAQRSATTATTTGNQTVANTAIYEPSVNGSLSLTRQQIVKTTTNPDGSSREEVDIFGRPSDARARDAGAAPSLTEKRIMERQKSASGAVIETQSVQLPSVNYPGVLDPPRKVYETVCRGECKKP
jgi:hypothetical protein